MGVAAITTSCSNKDLFDQDAYTEELSKSFPVTNIDANQTWATVGTVTANVTVNRFAGETYTLKVYDADPILNSKAVVLAKTSIVSGASWNTTVDYPLADSTLYVCCVDANARREVIPVDVTNGSNFNVTFGASSSASAVASRATSRASYDITDPAIATKRDVPYTEDQITSFINGSKAHQITNGEDVAYWETRDKKYENFYIASNISSLIGTSSGDFTAKRLIIAKGGTWTVNNISNVKDGVEVIIAKGGKINLNGQSLQSVKKSGYAFIVMPGAEITGNGTLTDTDGSSIYNAGTITTQNVNWTSGGVVYNSGTITLTKDFTLNSAANLINYNKISVTGTFNVPANGYVYNAPAGDMYGGALSLLTQATLINHSAKCHFGTNTSSVDNSIIATSCKLVFDDQLTPGILKIADGGSVQCKNLTLHSATLQMGVNALLVVTNSTKMEAFEATGPAQSSGEYAVCQLANVVSGYGPLNSFTGNIAVDITSAPTNDRWWGATVKYTAGAFEVGKKEATVSIDASECSVGYNTIDKGGDTDGSEFETTFCFEDNYPAAGDYDFNDAVIGVKRTVKDKVVTLVATLKAVGATLKSGAAIRLSGIAPSSITSVTSTGLNNNNTAFGDRMEAPGSNGYLTSKDGSSVVIPLYGDAHKVLGSDERTYINTSKTEGKTATPVAITITINTTSADVAKAINSNSVDVFIYNGKGEVHTYPWKDANAALYNLSQGKSDKVIWAISIPNFKYPIEYKSIELAYPDFEKWAQNAKSDLKWYENSVSGYVY